MIDLRYDVGKLFQMAFGINFPIYMTGTINIERTQDITYSGFEMKTVEESENMSYMGTPIISPTILNAGFYQRYNEYGELIKIETENFMLPTATLIDFRRAKNITKTDMLGSNGTVKEIFGFDDWIINIRGLCLDEPNNPAKNQIERLLQFEKIADSIEITGNLFQSKNINRICIENIEERQLEGSPNVIPFVIQACSDDPIELFLS